MADYSKNSWVQGANPAAPAGFPLPEWTGPGDPSTTDRSKEWFGGRNLFDTTNGWDTEFLRGHTQQFKDWQDKAATAGPDGTPKASVFFQQFDTEQNPEATGIALWDDPNGTYKRGDVFENGEKLENGNVFDQFGDAAYPMLARLVYDQKEQERLFRDGPEALQARLTADLDQNSKQALNAPTAEAFAEGVNERKEDLGGWTSVLGSVAAGAGGGAVTAGATGAAVGSVVPGLGTLIGGAAGLIGGTVVGGIGGFLNRDQMTELVARSQQQAEVAADQGNWLNVAGANVGGFAQLTSRAMLPVGNITQGVYDAAEGELGDGVSEYYAVNELGERKANGLWQVADVAATVTDSLLQFANPIGRAAYMTSTGAAVAGGVADLGQGAVFNPGSGLYDDLEGPGEWAAAAGSTGIDAIQLGMARGLARGAAYTRADRGVDEATRATFEGASGSTLRTLGGSQSVQRLDRAVDRMYASAFGTNLGVQGSERVVNGVRYFVDDAGVAVGKRATVQAFVPSEFVKWVPTGFLARSGRLADDGVATADDFFRAAKQLQDQGTVWTNGLLNAYAEGSEEAIQSFLDPRAYGETATGGEVMRAAVMGAAAGMGMSIGAQLQMGGRPDVQLNASLLQNAQQMRQLAADQQTFDQDASSAVGRSASEAIRERALSEQYAGDQPGVDGSLVVLGLTPDKVLHQTAQGQVTWQEAKYEANTAVMSAFRVTEILKSKQQSFQLFEADANRRKAEAEQELAQAQVENNADAIARAQAQIADADAQLADLTGMRDIARTIAEDVADLYDRYKETSDVRFLNMINDQLSGAVQGRYTIRGQAIQADREQIRRVVEIGFARHPYMGAASKLLLNPQVSELLTRNGSNGSVHVHQSVLLNPNADFDGDTVALLNSVYMPLAVRKQARQGTALVSTVGASTSPASPDKVDDRAGVLDQTTRKTVRIAPPESDAAFLLKVSSQVQDPNSEYAQVVEKELQAFRTWAYNRYTRLAGPGIQKDVRKAIKQFDRSFRAGVPGARLELINTLVNLDPVGFVSLSDTSPEVLSLTNEITLLMERISQQWGFLDYAKYDEYTKGLDPNAVPPTVGEVEANQFAIDKAVRDAQNASVNAALALGVDPTRAGQMLNYVMQLQAATDQEAVDTDITVSNLFMQMAETYMTLGSGEVMSAQQQLDSQARVQQRVLGWLRLEAEAFQRENPQLVSDELAGERAVQAAMVLLFQTPMPYVEITGTTGAEVQIDTNYQMTFGQFLLRKSVDIEQRGLTGMPADSPRMKQLSRLRAMTSPQPRNMEPGQRSYTAYQAQNAVFGAMNVGELLGDSGAILGRTASVSTLARMMEGAPEQVRRRLRQQWKGAQNPAYTHNTNKGDPPFTLRQIRDAEVNAYTIIVDGLLAVGNTGVRAKRASNQTAHDNAISVLKGVRTLITNSRESVGRELRKNNPSRTVTDGDVLRYLLDTNTQLADAVVRLIPPEALLGTFAMNDGNLFQARWVMQALLHPKPETGLKMIYFNSQIATLNYKSREAARHDDRVKEARNASDEQREERELFGVDYSSLRSRFQQVYWLAAQQYNAQNIAPMLRLEQAMYDDNLTLDQAFDVINTTPQLSGDRAELIPWHDDVLDWEASTEDQFNKALPSAELRENLALAKASVDHMVSARNVDAMSAEDSTLLEQMAERLTELGGSFDPVTLERSATSEVDNMLVNLWRLREYAMNSLDSMGGTGRKNVMMTIAQGTLVMHDKGTAAVGFEQVGDMLAFFQGWGLQGGVALEIDNLTIPGWEAVSSNLSRLAHQATDVQFEDGRVARIDMTDLTSLLNMLRDPLTTQFARAVLAPTTWDVNTQGTSQQYALSRSSVSITAMLNSSTFAPLYQGADVGSLGTNNAYDLLGLLEAQVRHLASKNADEKERRASLFLVQNYINEFLVGYTLGPNLQGLADPQLADQLIRDFMGTLTVLASTEESARKFLQNELRTELSKRAGTSEWQRALETMRPAERETFEITLLEKMKEQLLEDQARVAELLGADTELADNDPRRLGADEIRELEAKQEQLKALGKSSDLTELLPALDPRTYQSLAATQAALGFDPLVQYTPDQRREKVSVILEMLVTGDNIKQFVRDDEPAIIRKVYEATALGQALDLDAFSDTELETMSDWAIRLFLTNQAGGLGLRVGVIGSKEEGSLKYFDPGYAYLVDALFDEKLLTAMQQLNQLAGFNPVNKEITSFVKQRDRILNGLLNPRLLGVPPLAVMPQVQVAVNKAMRTAPTNSSLPMSGANPANMADMLAAGWASFAEIPFDPTAPAPFAEAVTGAAFTVSIGGPHLRQKLYDDTATRPLLSKLEHKFVTRIRLSTADGTLDLDATALVGDRSLTLPDGSPIQAGLHVLDLGVLHDYIVELYSKNPLLGDVSVEIDYVDRTKKPYTREYANNIYFEGVGREFQKSMGLSAPAAMYFAQGALTAQGMQTPLDALKKGVSLVPYMTSSRDTGASIIAGVKQANGSVLDAIEQLAMHAWMRTYETGNLLAADLPALQKLLSMRFLVEAELSTGESKMITVDEAISLETQGLITSWDMKPMSDTVSRTLMAGNFGTGIRGGYVAPPVLNLMDVDPFPQITVERLEALGLDKVSQEVELANSAAAFTAARYRTTVDTSPGGDSGPLLRQLSTQQSERLFLRTQLKNWDIRAINERNAEKGRKWLASGEMLQRVLRGTPLSLDDPSSRLNARINMGRIKQLLADETTNVIWIAQPGASSRIAEGILTTADGTNGFTGNTAHPGVLAGDAVILDLAEFMAANNDSATQAFKDAQGVIQKLHSRGARIVLGASTGDSPQLRNMLAEWINSGGVSFTPVPGSRHFFVPDVESSRTARYYAAQVSTSTETRVTTAEGATLAVVDPNMPIEENTVYVFHDLELAQQRNTVALLPSRFTQFGPGRIPFAFDIPSGVDLTNMGQYLMEVLTDTTAVAELDKLAQNAKGLADPSKVMQLDPRKLNDSGILPWDQAKAELLRILQTGNFDALYENRDIRVGSIIPVMDSQGAIVLARYGYKPPRELESVASTPGAQPPMKAVSTSTGARRLSVSRPSIEQQLTVAPGLFRVTSIFPTDDGLKMKGTVKYDAEMKLVWEGLGYKEGTTEFPNDRRPIRTGLGASGANSIGITRQGGMPSIVSKGAVPTFVDNFSDALYLTGWSFKQDLMNFFFPDSAQLSAADYDLQWNALRGMLGELAQSDEDLTPAELKNLLNKRSLIPAFLEKFQGTFRGLVASPTVASGTFTPRVSTAPATSHIVNSLLGVLMLPGVQLEHVLEGVGLLNVPRESLETTAVRRPPTILAELLSDRINEPAAFRVLMDRVNSMMSQEAGGRFSDNWDFEYTETDITETSRTQNTGVKLAYVTPIAAENNAATYAQKLNFHGAKASSPHTTTVINAGFGGRVAERGAELLKTSKPEELAPTTLQEFYAGQTGLLDLGDEEGAAFDALYARMHRGANPLYPEQAGHYSADRMMTPAEMRVLVESQKSHGAFGFRIDTTAWQDFDATKQSVFDAKVSEWLAYTNLPATGQPRALLDMLVRQMLGAPGPLPGQENWSEFVTYEMYLQTVDSMLENMREGLSPVHAGMHPLIDYDTLRMLYEASQTATSPWAPAALRKSSGGHEVARNWNGWVESIIGQLNDSYALFDSLYDAPLNGAWFSYQQFSSFAGQFGVTFDLSQVSKLGNYNINVQLSQLRGATPGANADMQGSIVFNDIQNMTLDVLLGRQENPTYRNGLLSIDASQVTKNANRIRSWKASKKMVKQKDMAFKDYRELGAQYMENSNAANVMMHNLTNVSLINRMLNIGIWVGGFIEMPLRLGVENITGALVGSTTGLTGTAVARWGRHKYDADEVAVLNSLAKVLGDSTMWRNEIDNELLYSITGPGRKPRIGPKSQRLEDIASGVTRFMSNPLYRMRGDLLAQKYLEAVVEELNIQGATFTIRQLAREMSIDPMWLQKQVGSDGYLSAHRAGLNRVAQLRITKPTMASRMVRALPNSMMSSARPSVNAAGHLLHLPLMFANFSFNVLTTSTGMDGWDQTAAMFFHGRKKPAFLTKNRMDTAAKMDFTDVVETLDLQRTFIRSGTTLTMIATAAMALGNLGFDGDDEEARRRERLAKYMRIPNFRDPLALQNDFTQAKAVYLDNIPLLGNLFYDESSEQRDAQGNPIPGTGRSQVVPHWMIQQFTSPLVGLQRFFDTGDVREVWDGYYDAFSAIPNSLAQIWVNSGTLASKLEEAAALEADPEYMDRYKMSAYATFLTRAFGVLERPLLENQMVNAMYQAADDYQRNPFVIPEQDAAGNIQRAAGTGVPVRSTATTESVDPETGEVFKPYLTRDPFTGQMMNYAKNSAVFSFLLAAGTGGSNSKWLRNNMVPTEVKVQRPELSDSDARKLILARLEGGGLSFQPTYGDIVQVLKTRAAETGDFYDPVELDQMARQYLNNQVKLQDMSYLDDEGSEKLTDKGAQAILEGLQRGTLNFEDAAMRGISMDLEQRKRVGAQILQDLTQDAMELGLTRDQASYVATRFYYGDKDTGAGGLLSIMNDKALPYSNTVRYNQLNTTYVIGPDGKPWATPFERANYLGAFGIPVPQVNVLAGEGLSKDAQGKIVDPARGLNVGLNALERQQEVPQEKIELDLEDAVNKGAAKAEGSKYGRSSGYGGYSGGGGSTYFQYMRALPFGTSPRDEDTPFINTSSPYIRRSRLDRERVFSERGRLKQWQ